ncbi:MAG: bifunctional aspartate kinase/homoserine dehydrogenase I [Planctomycetes bacterium]|nr:bifunctional aspartate kinase/homoserine dehydrogenase I [Planctomycetota bacterium]
MPGRSSGVRLSPTVPLAAPLAHKFGGSSLADAERIARVAGILLARSERQVVVVSAMQGVTDALIVLVRGAAARAPEWPAAFEALCERHRAAARLLLAASAEPVLTWLESEFRALHDLLHAQALVGHVSDDLLDLVQGLGEVWSSKLLDARLVASGAESQRVDARDVLVVEPGELGAVVDWEASRARLSSRVPPDFERLVVTGFVARTTAGRVTTLGRNGSDYSGAIFAALLDARELLIWTDVDGVLSADPRLVSEALLVEELSYAEACELSYFGAKVIHPQTMSPAIARGIPIVIRNTFRPEHPGTRIGPRSSPTPPVKGVTTFAGLALLDIEGAGMIGVPGTAERAFQALKLAGVSVVMISQGSSEHSICCVIKEKDAAAAQRAVRYAFTRELEAGQLEDVSVRGGIAALAVVGDGMAGTPGTAARLFGALGRAHVNVRAIAQGASERNISVAIDAADATRALRAVHAGFYLSAQTISVGLVGPGNVGSAFVRQLGAARERLLRETNVDLRLRAIASSRAMWLGEATLTPAQALASFQTASEPLDWARFAAHVQAEHVPHAVILDCSASAEVADRYAGWLARGVHVAIANKQAGAGPIERHAAIRRAAAQGGARWRYEATVGAGLPILGTLRDLVDTGDEIRAVEGVLSGTLAWLFNVYDGRESFSTLVRRAKDLGFTEPDPRDDLSGLDVARKLVILARECGWSTRLEDVRVEGLVPASLARVSAAEFLERLAELDGPIAARFEDAHAQGLVLRYVARLSADGEAHVGLAELPATHAFAHGRLTDNIVQFTTARYATNPLVVQGPGAGPEVTAAGVFADLLRIASSVGNAG